MKIDLDHLHHWMCAIRESEDPKRTLDAFWKGQIDSKLWLIENIRPFVKNPISVDINGGWVGVLASLLFQSDLSITKIRSIDIDPVCEPIARKMNKLEEIQGRFFAETIDMCDAEQTADLIINTSCEHMSQKQYEKWILNVPKESLIVLQSNNYNIPEHVRIANDLTDFISQSEIDVIWQGKLDLPNYTRYMIIGNNK
jgi:hypothetical protein